LYNKTSIYLYVPYIEELTKKNILKLYYNYPRLKRVIVFSSETNYSYDEFEFEFIFTTEKLGYKSCGVVNDSYFVSGINTFTETLKHNSCLHKKISIDKDGNIKNCPSMTESFGNITETTLEKAINNLNFKKYWNITKDQIKICKDCEFKNKLLSLTTRTEKNHQQPCET